MTEIERKAFKLIEALAEPCEAGDRDGDHNWRDCRRCMAIRQFDFCAKTTRELMQSLLALRTVWAEHAEPFIAWAQTYLDGGRWGGHDVMDAIRTELLERDAQLAQVAAALKEKDRLYHELLYQVGNKYPGETRHQTALRYLRRAEEPSTQAVATRQGGSK